MAPSPICAVAGDANLSGKHDTSADFGGSGEPDLGAEQRVLAHGRAVADLDEVVDLCAIGDAVSPIQARSMQALAWISTSLPMRTGPDCENLVPGTVICVWRSRSHRRR